MSRLTRPAAQKLAEFVHLAGRSEWNTPGILTALEAAAPTATAFDIAHALLNIAEDPTVRTPGMLPKPGAHWRRTDGAPVPRRGDHTLRCPDHPDQDMPHDHGGDMTPEQIAAKAAELRQAITKPVAPERPTPPPATDVETARARIDQEATA